MLIETMRWERLLRSFILVEPVCLECKPRRKRSVKWSALFTACTREPWTHTIPRLSFFMSSFTYDYIEVIILNKNCNKSIILLSCNSPLAGRLVRDRLNGHCTIPTLRSTLWRRTELRVHWPIGKYVQMFEGRVPVVYHRRWSYDSYHCLFGHKRKCTRCNRQRPIGPKSKLSKVINMENKTFRQ